MCNLLVHCYAKRLMLKKDLEALICNYVLTAANSPLQKCTAVVYYVFLVIHKLLIYTVSVPLKLGVLF